MHLGNPLPQSISAVSTNQSNGTCGKVIINNNIQGGRDGARGETGPPGETGPAGKGWTGSILLVD